MPSSKPNAAGAHPAPHAAPWYLDSVYYAIQVSGFADADGDGYGDLDGIIGRLDHLSALGVGTLWLLPLYVSSDRDNGYDVIDHRRIDPRYGGDDALRRLVEEAARRGIHVVLDLVGDHTSDQHPWFLAARRHLDAPERRAYVWERVPPPDSPEPIFPGYETGIWTYDEPSDRYYRHRFYSFEPDLDTHVPHVQDENAAIVRWWADRGVSGFRVDAASHMVERKGRAAPRDPHAPLRTLRAAAERLDPRPPLIGEADVPPDQYTTYFAEGTELDLLFNFYLAEMLFLAFARRSAEPVARALERLPRPPEGCGYLNFLRNLDELDLEQLSEGEREEVYAAFAPDPDMRIFDRGIRRRVAPMLGDDRRLLELAWSLLFAMPGVPLLTYGDEIGLGDDRSLPARWSVRTTMAWNSGPNGGFSRADPEHVVRPPRPDGSFGYRERNVADQAADGDSLLCWFGRLVRARRSVPELGCAEWRVLDAGPEAVSAVAYPVAGGRLVALHNLAPTDVEVSVAVPGAGGRAAEVVFGALLEPPSDVAFSAEAGIRGRLGPFGYAWLRLPS